MIRLKNILVEAPEKSTGARWLDSVKDIITVKSNFSATTGFIQKGKISQVLLNDIETAVRNTPSVTSIQIGSTLRTGKPNKSRHPAGLAVDIPTINGVNFQDDKHAKNTGVFEAHQDLVATFVRMGYSLNKERGHDKAILEFEFDRHKYDPKRPSTYNKWQHRHHIHVSNKTQTTSPIDVNKDGTIKSKPDIIKSKSDSKKTIQINKPLKNINELKKGDRGTAVKELQSLLAELGYEFTEGIGSEFKLEIYGEQTEEAVLQFQQNNLINLIGTGTANKITIDRLLNLTSNEKTTIKQENEAPPEEKEKEEIEKVTGVSFKIDRDRIDFKRSIAGETNRNNTCLVIYGGTPNNKYGPNYLVDKMPIQISRVKDIIYVQGDSRNWPISRIENYVPDNSVIDAVIGFSAGGNRIFPLIEDDYDFIGLIDPSVPKRYETIILKDNVYMFGNPSNWKGRYSHLGQRIQTIIDNNQEKTIYKNYDHFTEMVPEFLNTYKSKII